MPDGSIAVVIPVRDESPTGIADIVDFYCDGHWLTSTTKQWQLIIVDDGSVVPFAGASYRHDTPQGYGAALKTGIRHATAEWIVTADGDGQHRLRDIIRLVEFVQDFPDLDMVIGDRRLKDTGVRLLGRKGLNWVATVFAGRWIPDLNSGMRIFRRKIALGYLPILSDRFSFTTSLTLSMLTDGYRVDWMPIKVAPRTNGVSKVVLWQDGWRTLNLIIYLGLALRTRRLRQWLRPLWQ